ncbi:MAG: prolyl oligopeptidase family serine peptidase [Gemmatimonadaceae bacterium]
MRTTMRRALLPLGLLCTLASHATAQLTVDRWLVLGPLHVTAPMNAASGDSAILDAARVSVDAWPSATTVVAFPDAPQLRWTEGNGAGKDGDVTWAAAYLTTDRFTTATISVAGEATTRRVTLDGERVNGDRITLRTGKHMLVVQRLGKGPNASDALVARITPVVAEARIATNTDPVRAGTWKDFHNVASVNRIELDPTGTKFAMAVRRYDAESDRYSSTLSVHEVASGKALADVRLGGGGSLQWSPDGKRLLVTAPTDKSGAQGSDLWEWNSVDGTSTRVLRAEPGLSVVGYSPDAAWVYFIGSQHMGTTQAPKAGEATRLTEVWDRWTYERDKSHLYALHLASGSRVKLVGDTAVSVSAATLSPDGKAIAFTRSVPTNAQRPWLRAEIWTMDIASGQTRRVLELPQEAFNAPGSLAWSPDSKALAFCASAKEVYKGNDPAFSVYENELYATPIDNGRIVHLSEGFVPSVGGGLGCSKIAWNAADGRIYVPVDDGAKTPPARTKRPVTSALEPTTLEVMKPLPGPVTTAFDLTGTTMVLATESPTSPSIVTRLDLRTGATQPIVRPNDQSLAAVSVPSNRDWSFRNSRGEDIEAWYWLPPNFDSTKTYPMIVHYYGGTLPMKKNFEQRLLWFASNGYVVLFMNPAGTPGYGQKFANYHINDWGWPAASDIIEGTEQFTKSHAFVDASRVGNFGHSYGGFMTMLIHTRTKIFRTGIELAGISNIADYWGAGWSGFSYTDGTCPGCYPWNRKDVYVDRSPLFSADKITSPMLLIHGTDDTNVVPTESEQMFTALRMLGREAELVRVQGENHGINSRPSVEMTRDGIMLDWFDKYLKGQPAAWAARWGIAAPKSSTVVP